MRQKRGQVPRPIPQQEKSFKGITDSQSVVDKIIQTKCSEIQTWLNECDQETKAEIHELFTLSVPSMKNCGDLVFDDDDDDYEILSEKFEEITATQ